MAKPREAIDVPELGLRFEFLATAEETGGAYTEVEAIGRPRGFIRLMHVHADQDETHTVLEGVLRVKLHGKVHELHVGESITVPRGAPHYQLPGGPGSGRTRVRWTPSGRIEEFLERLGALSRSGQLTKLGYPRPLAGAAFVRDLGASGHGAWPSLKTQQRFANGLLRLASREYEFVDEWDVAAPPEAVFDALADARSYPQWWRPVYIDVEADDGPPAVGKVTRQHFKGRLPYHLHTRTTTVRLERPHMIQGETEGDLRGTGIWTLTPTDTGTHVRFDWRVHADRRLLRLLTPLLRPALRWNHNWAIARAIEGLEPYARSRVAI
jgi:mannose-6-phosphate isomerase-like protein (cupin superfamily)/uncharacterized protein YndB with AHSA1/START domain